ncbi:26794_t:CDS:2, partial [Racocetra persica]
MIASSADIGQENILTHMKNKPKKRNSVPWPSTNIKVNDYQKNSAPMQLHNTNIKVNSYQKNAINLTNDKQNIVILEDNQDNTDESVLEPDALATIIIADIEPSTVIPENNTSPLLKNGLHFSMQKLKNIATVSKIVEDDAQDS